MADDQDRIGTVLDGKYVLERLIGSGGMGAVYAARQLQLDRTVALKLLRPDVTSDERAVARFNREARAAARIEHANAVRVYDFGTSEDGSAFIVMEYIEGVPLRVMMRRTRILPFEVVLDVILQAASGIAAAHACGIVHRDLKPENLMVHLADDGAISVKVVDFGLAKVVAGDSTQITSPAEMIGTPRYMAPEQFTGDDLDARVDVYSLGVMLFEMLAGRPPFDGTFTEVVGKHVYAEPPDFDALGVQAPEGVERVIRRALAKRPTERTASVLELARDLARCFGIELPSGTAVILPAAFTSRSRLLLDELPTVDVREPRPVEEYLTQRESRDDTETQLRGAPPRPAPSDPLTAVLPPPPNALVGGAFVWIIAACTGIFVVLVAASLGGVYVYRVTHSSPTLAEAPATPAVAPSAPAAAPTTDAPATTLDDDAPPTGLEGIPFYIDGGIVIYASPTTYPLGSSLEIHDTKTNRRERFAFAPNAKGTKWMVSRDARSDPSGLTIEQLVPVGVLVEILVRRPDGTATDSTVISRTDE
jgi:serine/threonine-protein kinase